MKQLILSFLVAISFFLAFPQHINAQIIPDEGEEIVVTGNESIPDNGPARSPIIVPFAAIYYASMSYVEIGFLFNVGCVTITLTNLATGSYSSAMVDSQNGSALIPVTGGSGPYKIEFTIGDGSSFVGFFSVI